MAKYELDPMPDPRQVATALGIDYDALMLRMMSLGTTTVGCHRPGFPACQHWGLAPLAEIKTWLCPDHRPIDLVPAEPGERDGKRPRVPLLARLEG
jgi:hypothetical protein